jgi:hypothetical protein
MISNPNRAITNDPILSLQEWTTLKSEHESALSEMLDPYLEKRSRQMKDPVLDFLFEYYAFRPSYLRRWSPGIGVKLEIDPGGRFPEVSELVTEEGFARLNPEFFPQKRVKALKWTLNLLIANRSKKPFFGCFGMHEWAMVYRAEEVRHDQIPFRLTEEEIAEFVESRPLLCTHFDAFRFFTDKALPLNRHNLNRDNFEEMEQPGCVHTNMDLYKWAFKLYPWISSEVIREAFFNAVETRKTDMQASPYDATEFGLQPIKIETEFGRAEYLDRQMEIYENSKPVRERVIEGYEKVLRVVG